MLKPTDPAPAERPVGELLHELIEDGKAYARSEIDLAKAMATAKGKALLVPAATFGAAFVFALAAVTALAVGIVMALAKFVGPLAAGFLGLVIFLAIGGALAWYGVNRVKRVL